MTREALASKIEAVKSLVVTTPEAAASRNQKLRQLEARLAELDPPVHFDRLGVLRNDMPRLFDVLCTRLEETPVEDPASAPFPWIRPTDPSPWGSEAQEELLEIALGQCRCRPGYICPGCQEAIAENQAEGGDR